MKQHAPHGNFVDGMACRMHTLPSRRGAIAASLNPTTKESVMSKQIIAPSSAA
jgi:hypothetical protein